MDGMEIELTKKQLAAMKSFTQTAQAEQQEKEDELKNSPDEYVKMSVDISMPSLAVAIRPLLHVFIGVSLISRLAIIGQLCQTAK